MSRALSAVLVAVALVACAQEQQSPAYYEAEFERQLREYDRQTEIADQHLKRDQALAERSEALLKLSEAQAERYQAFLTLTERQATQYQALLERWEAQTDRYDKILDAMEKAIPK